MGFLDGLKDLFSNDAAEDAARKSAEGRQLGYSQQADQYGLGRGAISQGYGKAAGAIQSAADLYKPGAQAYGDVSGAHGVEGLQRGTDLYKNSGQYGLYGVLSDAATQAVARARSAGGDLLSGNHDWGAAKVASDLALGGWGQFQQGLSPYLGNYGNAQQQLANVYTGEGTALNANYMGLGNAANATQTGIGQDQAGAEMIFTSQRPHTLSRAVMPFFGGRVPA